MPSRPDWCSIVTPSTRRIARPPSAREDTRDWLHMSREHSRGFPSIVPGGRQNRRSAWAPPLVAVQRHGLDRFG